MVSLSPAPSTDTSLLPVCADEAGSAVQRVSLLYGVFYNTECTGLLLRWNVQHSTCAVPLPPPPPTSKSACPTPLVSQPPEDRGPNLVKQSMQISYPGHPSHRGHPFHPCLLVHFLGTANQPPENADFRSQARTLSSNQSKKMY